MFVKQGRMIVCDSDEEQLSIHEWNAAAPRQLERQVVQYLVRWGDEVRGREGAVSGMVRQDWTSLTVGSCRGNRRRLLCKTDPGIVIR